MGSDGATELALAVKARVEAGHGAPLADGASGVVVMTLPSGSRLAIDPAGIYWVLPDGGLPPARFTRGTHAADELPNGTEGRFSEALEVPRHDFEDALESGAREAGLPPQPAAHAFPAVDLLRAVLSTSSAYAARLALRWLLPSERATLATAIAAVARDENMTQDVRNLAKHMI